MRTIAFHDHNTVRAAFLEDRFVRMRLFFDRILKKMRGSITGIQNLL